MKIIVISDLHGNLPQIPKGDLLLICGDVCPLDIQGSDRRVRRWFNNEFYHWIEELPVKKVLFIAGNHDWFAYRNKGAFLHQIFNKDFKATYLEDELYEYEGLKIYGTPWCKIFYNWAFMVNDESLKEKYSNIPEGLDILITHDAPTQNELGLIHDLPYTGTDASNHVLTEIVHEKKPKYHFCGHIHSGNHELNEVDGTKFANCSLLNETYYLTYPPLIIEL